MAHREPGGPLFEAFVSREELAEGDAGAAPSPVDVFVRATHADDVEAIVEIWVERNGGDPEDLQRRWRIATNRSDPEVLMLSGVVLHGAFDSREELAGYAKAHVFHPPEDAPANCAPAGWYLSGVSVARAWRRRGIGLALTRARLECLRDLTHEVYYFANVENGASIALHERLGFEPVTEDFWWPRASFEGGRGRLYRAALRPH